jgi:hypothetical protein
VIKLAFLAERELGHEPSCQVMPVIRARRISGQGYKRPVRFVVLPRAEPPRAPPSPCL